jgi:peptidoglycan/LPS O-acetylase OafA/YrhL
MLENKNATHYYWLDLFRGLAALTVVTTHCRTMLFIEYALLPASDQTPLNFIFFSLTRIAHEAVLLFFVLSGFLVGGKVIQRLKAGTFDLRSYALDRTVRIMLPLLSAFIIILISNTVTGQRFRVIDYIGNLFSLQGILVPWVSGPLWSLAYEVWFYILMGAVALLFVSSKETYKYVAVLIIFINCLIFSYCLKPAYLFVWLLGAVSFFNVKKNNYLLYGALCLLITSLVLYQLYGKESPTLGRPEYKVAVIFQVCIGLSMCVIVQQITHYRPRHKLTIWINKLGSRLAAFSYTLYLTHLPIVHLLIYFGFPKSRSVNVVSVGYYIGAVGIVVVSAYLIYLVFERRTKYVKEVLRNKIFPERHVIARQSQTAA